MIEAIGGMVVGHVTSGAHSTSTAVFGSKTKDSTRYDMI
jgi:hypothetical protein